MILDSLSFRILRSSNLLSLVLLLKRGSTSYDGIIYLGFYHLLTRFEFYRVLPVRSCDVGSSVAITYL